MKEKFATQERKFKEEITILRDTISEQLQQIDLLQNNQVTSLLSSTFSSLPKAPLFILLINL